MFDRVRHYESHVRIHLVNSLRWNGLRGLLATDTLREMESLRFMTRSFLAAIAISILVLASAAPVRSQSGTGAAAKPRGKSAKSSKKPKVATGVASFESRRADWIRRKEAASAAGTSGPEPLEQYLVSEVLVTGLFETDTGFGVFLFASPTRNTFFATNGAKLFNGRLVSIEKISGSFADDAQIVFEERTGKGAAQRVVKRVVAVPSKVEEVESAPEPDEKPPPEKPPAEKPATDKPPLATH